MRELVPGARERLGERLQLGLGAGVVHAAAADDQRPLGRTDRLGGALQLPREPANLELDLQIIGGAFVVVVVGGMGSIPGAFVAALLKVRRLLV